MDNTYIELETAISAVPAKYAAVLRELPAAQVRPAVRAAWEWDVNGMDWNIGAWICSHCHVRPETWWATVGNVHPLRCSGSRFCGNCGADMRSENDG